MGHEDIEKGESENKGGLFYKWKEPSEVRIHIISTEPFSYFNYFNKAQSKGVRVPLGTTVPGIKFDYRHVYACLLAEGKEEPRLAIIEAPQTLAAMFHKAWTKWGKSYHAMDFDVTVKKGSNGFRKYDAVASPTSGWSTKEAVPVLKELIKFSTPEEIQAVCVPDKKVNAQTVKMLQDVALSKGCSKADLASYIKEQFKAAKLEDLSPKQAEQTLEYLNG